MPLSDAQIERYSRQIILPEVGGRGQERILRARVMVAGAPDDLEPALAYIVGAGVGTVLVRSLAERAATARVIAAMRELNPESRVAPAPERGPSADLMLMLAGGDTALAAAADFSRGKWMQPIVFARLDRPAKLAIVPKPPPCLACVGAGLLAPARERAETAGFIAMLAAAETLKMIVRGGAPPGATIVEFDGYASRQLKAAAGSRRCPCAKARTAHAAPIKPRTHHGRHACQ